MIVYVIKNWETSGIRPMDATRSHNWHKLYITSHSRYFLGSECFLTEGEAKAAIRKKRAVKINYLEKKLAAMKQDHEQDVFEPR
jgi:hypothetical protein